MSIFWKIKGWWERIRKEGRKTRFLALNSLTVFHISKIFSTPAFSSPQIFSPKINILGKIFHERMCILRIYTYASLSDMWLYDPTHVCSIICWPITIFLLSLLKNDSGVSGAEWCTGVSELSVRAGARGQSWCHTVTWHTSWKCCMEIYTLHYFRWHVCLHITEKNSVRFHAGMVTVRQTHKS